MRKTLSVITILLFAGSLTLAQSESKTATKINREDATNAAQVNDYSESVPYKPREFKIAVDSKQKKESKKDTEKENPMAAPSAVSLNETNNNPVITENSLLTIPVSVIDANGNPIQNLTKTDFKIYIDEQEQKIADFGIYDQPINLILFLDVSPSTSFEIEEVQKYAASIVNQLRPNDKVMLVAFDERARILADLTDDRQQVNKALKKAKFGGGTSLYEVIKNSLQKSISQINGRKLIVLLTDGVDTTSQKASYENSLLEAEKNDALFFPIYLDTYPDAVKMSKGQVFINGGNRNSNQAIASILSQVMIPKNSKTSMNLEQEYERARQYLADLALLSGGKAFAIQNLKKLNESKVENVFEPFRNQYYINVNYSGEGKIGQRRQIKVRVNRPNLSVKARGSYIVGENKQSLPKN